MNWVVLGSISLSMVLSAQASETRTTKLLNFDWEFRHADSVKDLTTALGPGADWRQVQLPHDASIYGAFIREGSDPSNGWRPRKAGVYRKRFVLPEKAKGRCVMVQFQGVYRDARVWFNGVQVAHQRNGYLGFETDLTPHMKPGEENTLVVTYDNRKPGTSRWYTGEGIYRDVWLLIVAPLHVPLHGTYVTTPTVTPDLARVDITTEIRNSASKETHCRLLTELISPSGETVATAVAVAPVRIGETYLFKQRLDVTAPALWDLEHPQLYHAVSKIYRDGSLVDVYTTRFGIREIRMTPDKGLLLNGKKVIAKGGNLHHDLGCLGTAALKAGYERHIDELKAIGCNSMRLAHNPHAPVLLDVCDEKGILVFDELYDKWTSQFYGGDVSFESQWPADLRQFLRRDRNHPSVYIWSMGNEVLKQMGKYDEKFETPEAAADYGVGLMKRMAEFTHRFEPTRPVTAGLFPARADFTTEWDHWDDPETFTSKPPAEMAFYMDVVSWNYTENMFAQDHADYPQLMFIASESASNLEFGTRRPSWLELDTTYVIGHYYWSGYDYLGESSWPTKSWGRAFIDLAGWVTPIGRYYQSFYDEQPMVHIMVRDTDKALNDWFNAMQNKRWNWYPMTDHWTWPGRDTAQVTTFTNCEEVELFLNNKSMGVKRLADAADSHIDWEIPWVPGELKAMARNNGKLVREHVLYTADEPVAIQLTPHKEKLRADGLDLVYVDVTLRDAKGCLVPLRGKKLHFNVTGPAINAGVANGCIASNELWQADMRETWDGRCRLVLRAQRDAGEVTVTVLADNLNKATLRIEAVEP